MDRDTEQRARLQKVLEGRKMPEIDARDIGAPMLREEDGMDRDEAMKIVDVAKNADWGQVVANGGPPCFAYLDGKFCLRAERWAGHGKAHHHFVSLAQLLEQEAAKMRLEEAEWWEALAVRAGWHPHDGGEDGTHGQCRHVGGCVRAKHLAQLRAATKGEKG